jgi:hypothetical protein
MTGSRLPRRWQASPRSMRLRQHLALQRQQLRAQAGAGGISLTSPPEAPPSCECVRHRSSAPRPGRTFEQTIDQSHSLRGRASHSPDGDAHGDGGGDDGGDDGAGQPPLPALARRRLLSPPAAIYASGVVDGLAKVRAEGTHWKIVRALAPPVAETQRRITPEGLGGPQKPARKAWLPN